MKRNDETVLSGMVERPAAASTPGVTVTTMCLTGDREAMAIVEAVRFLYPALTGRKEPTEEDLRALVGQKVTLLQYGETMFGVPALGVREGTLFEGREKTLAFLPKGARTRGFRLVLDRVLDVEPGYAKGFLRAKVAEAVGKLPALRPLTQQDLDALPDRAPDEGPVVTLAVLGTLELPDGKVPGCLWLLHSYMKEDDIAEGVLVVPAGAAAESEHGSVYGRQLLRAHAGVAEGFARTLREALTYTECDGHARALEALRFTPAAAGQEA